VAPEPLTGAGVGARSTLSRLGPLSEPSVALQILAADSQLAGPHTGPASYRWIVARALVCRLATGRPRRRHAIGELRSEPPSVSGLRSAREPPLAPVVSPAGARMNELAQSARVPPPSQRATPRAEELPAPPRPVASRAEPGTDLREQRLAIEAARQELSAGRVDAALAKLDDYRVRFPRLAFHQESIVLRIEALRMRGDHASARSLGRTFLDANPDSPLARRVRSLTGLP
jgi:hypothetical protein